MGAALRPSVEVNAGRGEAGLGKLLPDAEAIQ